MAVSQELTEKLERARDGVRKAVAHYKATWKEHPTAKGFPLVDKALDALHKAERDLAVLVEEVAEASR